METTNRFIDIIVNPNKNITTAGAKYDTEFDPSLHIIIGEEDSVDALEDILNKFSLYHPEFKRLIMNHVQMFLEVRGYKVEKTGGPFFK